MNTGGCAEKTINVDPDASPEQTVKQLTVQTLRLDNENCSTVITPEMLAEKGHDAKLEQIDFKPGDWR